LIAQIKAFVEVCRVIEVTQPTYHRWRQQYGGKHNDELFFIKVTRLTITES
jgi:transposase-like protein